MCKTVRCIRRFSVLCSGAATIEVSSTKMDMNSLIREVSLRPPLWDRKSIHHHNRYALDKLWNEVAVKLNVSRVTARKKWKNLRDKYRSILNTLQKQKHEEFQSTDFTYQWRYFDLLGFLKDQFKSRPPPSPLIDDITIDFDDITENISNSPGHQSSISNESSFTKISRVQSEPENQTIQDPIGLDRAENVNTKCCKSAANDNSNFFKSLLPLLKEMSTLDKLDYRMNILQATKDFLSSCTIKYAVCSQKGDYKDHVDECASDLEQDDQNAFKKMNRVGNKLSNESDINQETQYICSNHKTEDDNLNFFKSLLPLLKGMSIMNKLDYRMKIIKTTKDFLSLVNASESSKEETDLTNCNNHYHIDIKPAATFSI